MVTRSVTDSVLGRDASDVLAPLARLAPITVAAIAFALFAGTLMPDVGFWDTAEFQTVPPILGTAHPTGFPTYVLIGWVANAVLAPLGEPAFRMNLLSAVFVALASGATVILVRRLTGVVLLGVAAGLGLAATPIAWGISTHADPHALHLLLVGALLIALVGWQEARRASPERADRWLVAATVVFGLSVGNHSLTLLLALPVGLYVLAVEPRILRRPRFVGLCVAVLVGTMALVYLELPLRAGLAPAALVYGRPDTLDGFRYIVLAEQFRGSIVDPFGALDRKAADLMALTAGQFGPFAPLIPLAFIVTVDRRPRYALLTGLAVAITVFFSASYVNADITRYYLGPMLMAWTWLAILAAAVVETLPGLRERFTEPDPELEGPPPDEPPTTVTGRRSRRAGLAFSIAAIALLLPTVAVLPERAAAADRSDDAGARPWLEAALGAFDENAVVVSWWSYSTTLWYAQHVEGRRPDLWIVDDRTRLDLNLGGVLDVIDANFDTRPVFLIRSNASEIERLRERYVIEPAGEDHLSGILRVVARVESTR